MRSILTVAGCILRLEARDRSNLFWMLAMPIAFIGIFGNFFSASELQRTALGVDDRDGSYLSQMLVADLERVSDLVIRREAAASPAPAAAPPAPRSLRIPAGFTDSLAAGKEVALVISATSNADEQHTMIARVRIAQAIGRLLAQLAEIERDTAVPNDAHQQGAANPSSVANQQGAANPSSLANQQGAANPSSLANQQAAGNPGSMASQQAAANSRSPDHHTGGSSARDLSSPEFRRRYQDLLARPELIQVVSRTSERGHVLPSGFAGSAQSMLVLFLLMNTAIAGAVTLAQERQSRVLSRLATFPVSRFELLAGRVLGLLALAMTQAVIILIVGAVAFRVSWGNEPLALFSILLCLGLCSSALGVLLGGILRTPEQAGALAWIVPLFLGALGGTWWPLEIVPGWMRTLGHISPAAWAMDGIHAVVNFGRGPAGALVPCAVLLAATVVLLVLGARQLRTVE